MLFFVTLFLCAAAEDLLVAEDTVLSAAPVARKLVPKSADQSSNEGAQYAKWLIDAKGSKTCAQTRKELHPWNRVVLPKVYTIQDVIISGTAKGLISRSVQLTVNLYNAATGKFVGTCGRFDATSKTYLKTISCRKMKGSAILIQTLGTQGMVYLRTCNIVVRGYAAGPAPRPTPRPTPRPQPIVKIHARGAEQVGTTDKKGANLIIDGLYNTCSYTTKSSRAWQRVYFDGYQSISSVAIAGKARSSRLIGRSKITIEVNVMRGNQKYGLCGIYTVDSNKSYTKSLSCKGFKGDNIRIEITDGSAYLMTCEVTARGRKA